MNKGKTITSIASAAGLLVLILDSRTGFRAAQDGINLCINTLIPSLFPFFIFSMLLTRSMAGQSIKLLRPISKLCRIPIGSESLIAIGFLGGYPVGAQNVLAAYYQDTLSKADARRMAVFCNNAGPAFLFGYLGTLFENPIYPWIIWIIHIFSALFVGWVLPGGSSQPFTEIPGSSPSMSQTLNQAIRVMGQVCAWVVIFRVIIGFLNRWFFWAFPKPICIFLNGIMELSNGCADLSTLPSTELRFIFASTMLGFGGLCVFLQTSSIAGTFPLPFYLPGKAFQGCISFLLSYWIQFFLPNSTPFIIAPPILIGMILFAAVLMMILRKQEKPVAISENLLYNQASCEKRRTICSSGKKSKNPASTVLSVQS